MELAQRLEGIEEYYFSQKLREIDALNLQGKNIINLGIGSPDLPPHPDVIRTLQEESLKPDVHGYQSYKGSAALRKAMSSWYKNWYGVTLDAGSEILPLIGSKEGIMHICMTYLNTGDEVLLPNPGYPTYKSAVKLAGGKGVEYELKEENAYQPDFEKLEKDDLTKIKLMFVNYPHMPTGQLPSRELFEKLVRFARRHDILIVHDNPYSFTLNEYPMSMLSVEDAKDHVIELNSLSKSHHMAGWRVGMLCGAKARIDEVLRFKSNMDSGTFLPVQLAAVVALNLPAEWYRHVNAIYRKRRDNVFALLDLMKCRYSKEQAGLFVWAAIPEGYTDDFKMSNEILHDAGVFFTPGSIFGSAGKNYIRVSLCCSEEKISECVGRISQMLINKDLQHV